MPGPRCAPCIGRRRSRHRSALPTILAANTNTDFIDTPYHECLHIMVVLYHTTTFCSTERAANPARCLRAASPQLAVLARGGDPPEPPGALRAPSACAPPSAASPRPAVPARG